MDRIIIANPCRQNIAGVWYHIENDLCEVLGRDIGREITGIPQIRIESLNLLRPIYSKTAAYGHFGRMDPDFHWEKIDKVSALKSLL